MKIEKIITEKDEQMKRIKCKTVFEATEIDMKKNPVIAVVGSGGKTSLIMEMSKELEREKIYHLIMTTTHMWPFDETVFRMSVGEIDNSGKLTIPDDDHWRSYIGKRPILIEADGSRGLPLKLHALHEPMIPDCATHVIGVIGATCLGKPLSEVCHRYQLMEKLGTQNEVTIEMLAKIINHPVGLRKSVGSRPFAMVINQADTIEIRDKLMLLNPYIKDNVDFYILTCKGVE